MESFEVLRKSIHEAGVKSVASDMGLSTSLIYKWCQPNNGSDAAGADNPLDRLMKIIQLTNDPAPILWLCEQVDGFFTKNPPAEKSQVVPILKATQLLLNEFSDVLAAVSQSYENDNSIDSTEAKRIRNEWEVLKRTAESFVISCENGAYDKTFNE